MTTVARVDDPAGGVRVRRGAVSRVVPGDQPRTAEPAVRAILPLDRIDAVLFDLDGVLTDTASLHRAAWTEVFSEVFADVAARAGTSPAPFTAADYRRLVDGQGRFDGVRHVLADRHLDAAVPEGHADDPPGLRTAWSIAALKDARFATLLRRQGPHPFPGSTALLRRLHGAAVPVAVVSASRHCDDVLAAAGLDHLIAVRVDGSVAAAMRLPGKPDPATYLEAAVRLGVDPARAAVVEDALAGVEAGRRGGFGLVLGVARRGHADELHAAGADTVVEDLAQVVIAGRGPLTDGWHLCYTGADARHEGVREALCTLANGYLGTRGARCEATDDGTHYPGTYLAGVYNRLWSDAGGRRVEHESLVKAPNWLPVSFSVDGGPWLGEDGVSIVADELRLDLRAGMLIRRFRMEDGQGRRTAVTERRLVSMSDVHLAGVSLDAVAENWSGTLRIRSGIDGAGCAHQTAEAALLAHCHLQVAGSGEEPPDQVWLAARTTQSGIVIAEAARTRVEGAHGPALLHADGTTVAHELAIDVAQGARCHVEKIVGIYTSRDPAISEPVEAARRDVAAAPRFAELAARHRAAWARLWSQSRIEVDMAGQAWAPVNLHLFHLLQVAAPAVTDLDSGMGARGLHGEGYEGHVFWDELFVHPVLALHLPATAWALLRYRQRRLTAARRLARDTGDAGARYPWQSGSDGRDETPTVLFNPRSGRWMPDRSRNQRHVGLAIAYACWQHWQLTGDADFLAGMGVEIIVDVARHFAHLARRDGEVGRWHIRGVMGPDEFHDGYPWTDAPGVDDNAYTNVLAAWVMARAVEVAGALCCDQREDVLGRLGVDHAELALFGTVSRGLHVPFHDGVISQFAGYERLQPIDLDAYRAQYGNVGRLDLILEAEGDTVRRYQVAKQADALMLFYLFSDDELQQTFAQLGYDLPDDMIRRTLDYYTARTTHGSTLSCVVHAWVTARRDRRASWDHFAGALAADMADTQGGTTREGVHLGAMAGTVDLLQRCYTGLEARGGTLILDPALPDPITGLRVRLAYRGHRLDVEVDQERVSVTSAPCDAAPLHLVLAGRPVTLWPGQRVHRRLHPGMSPAHTESVHRSPEHKEATMAPTTDPVCGMTIEQASAAASTTRDGVTYYFCSPACQKQFQANPDRYVAKER